jgi:hypothetical protein
MSTQHTPTPWAILHGGHMKRYDIFENTQGDNIGFLVCTLEAWMQSANIKANAEHIVRCVNSHDDLLAALQDTLCDLEALKLLGHKLGSYEHTQTKARAAIAKAEENQP